MIVRRFFFIVVAAAAQICSAASDPASEEFFETRIRPALLDSCFVCHGGRATEQGLRVDSRKSLLAGGKRGPAIVTR
jgi:hypothetical protein